MLPKLFGLLMLVSGVYCGPFSYKVRVDGVITCGGRPLYGQNAIKIVLMDNNIMGREDAISSTMPNSRGVFTLEGEDSGFPYLKPYIAIHHRCNKDKECRMAYLWVKHHPEMKICAQQFDFCHSFGEFDVSEAEDDGQSDKCSDRVFDEFSGNTHENAQHLPPPD